MQKLKFDLFFKVLIYQKIGKTSQKKLIRFLKTNQGLLLKQNINKIEIIGKALTDNSFLIIKSFSIIQ
jgi:hypothetical protein